MNIAVSQLSPMDVQTLMTAVGILGLLVTILGLLGSLAWWGLKASLARIEDGVKTSKEISTEKFIDLKADIRTLRDRIHDDLSPKIGTALLQGADHEARIKGLEQDIRGLQDDSRRSSRTH